MIITRGSTPSNRTPDLLNRSTDLRKILGIVGTPHGESMAKILSTKTCQIKRNRRNTAKNSSNPRTLKTPKSSPFALEFGRGIKGKKNHEEFMHTFPTKSPRERSRNRSKKIAKKGLRKSPKRTNRNNTSKP
jgi:hypothetical protein